MTPEARCSLHLKQHELRLAGREAERGALATFEALPCIDLLDESDAILRVKFQLVYACGDAMRLPSLEQRCAALRAVLDALLRSPRVAQILDDERVAVRAAGAPGCFFEALQLLPGGELERAMPALRAAIASHVVTNPPAKLKWLQRFAAASKQQGDAVMRYLTDSSASADSILPASAFKSADRRNEALAVRGQLAVGVIVHSLSKRWRVDYGVAPPGPARRKRIAIPFRAADTPAERSEYAFADSTLTLTALSYALGGLTDEEVLQGFEALEALNPVARAKEYAAWFAASAPGLGAAEAESISEAVKLDLTSVAQKRLLCTTFRRSLGLVLFWLEACVLPMETVQYPSRLKTTAWQLRPADGSACCGFSGTNDAHRLLPLHVAQACTDSVFFGSDSDSDSSF